MKRDIITPAGIVRLERPKPTSPHAPAWQPRDIDILQAVLEDRFLSRSLLGVLFPPDPTKAPDAAHTAWRAKNPGAGYGVAAGTNLDRRLRRLAEAAFLDRFQFRRTGELVYAITREGERFLRISKPDLVVPGSDWNRLNQRARDNFIEHTVMTARFHTALTLGLREISDIKLTVFLREGAETRFSYGEHSINPDAFFVLENDRGARAFFLECDRGTASMPRIERKLRDYTWLLREPELHPAIRAADIPSFAVLFSVATTDKVPNPDTRVSAILNRMIDLERNLERFFVTREDRYADHFPNTLAEIWLRADADPQSDADQPGLVRVVVADELP